MTAAFDVAVAITHAGAHAPDVIPTGQAAHLNQGEEPLTLLAASVHAHPSDPAGAVPLEPPVIS